MKNRIHLVAGVTAIAMITVFWISTVVSELTGSPALIAAVKTLIPWGFLILIPALAATGGTGFALAGGRTGGLVSAKKKRMPIIAANGLFVLLPAAFYLAHKARLAEFDAMFYAVQGVELVFGAINITLLFLNARDGFRMTAGRRRRV